MKTRKTRSGLSLFRSATAFDMPWPSHHLSLSIEAADPSRSTDLDVLSGWAAAQANALLVRVCSRGSRHA